MSGFYTNLRMTPYLEYAEQLGVKKYGLLVVTRLIPMDSETQADEAKSTGQVMQEVLLAEEQARQKIKDCEQNAQQQLEAARQAAHRISERANLRISRIHKISQHVGIDLHMDR